MRYFRFPAPRKLNLCHSAPYNIPEEQSVTIVTGQLIGLHSLEDGTDKLARNVVKYQIICIGVV